MRQADRLTTVAGNGRFALTLWPATLSDSLSDAIFVAIDRTEAGQLLRSLEQWIVREAALSPGEETCTDQRQ